MPEPFALRYAPLGAAGRGWGEVARLPWDEEIFGFGVADLRLTDGAAVARDPSSAAAALAAWAAAAGIELLSASLPAGARGEIAVLPGLGFAFVEPTIRVSGAPRAARQALSVRAAEEADRPGVLAIAGSAFDAGRYHADPRFPRALANRRYVVWAARALDGSDPADRVYVVGPVGAPEGFMHVRVERDRAELRLGGVARAARDGLAGYALWLGTLEALRSADVASVAARISAVNTPVLNLYAGLGFHFDEPQLVYHWHGPGIRSLDPADDRGLDEARHDG